MCPSNADAVVTNPADGVKYFVKPYEVEEPFADFLHYVRTQELDKDMLSNVKYAQTRMQATRQAIVVDVSLTIR